MSKSSLDRLAYEIKIDGKKLSDLTPLMSCLVEHSINKISRATIDLAMERKATGDETFAILAKDVYLPGKKVVIKAGYQDETKTAEIFQGVIVSLGLESSPQDGSGFIRLRCAHNAIKLTLNQSSRYFAKKTDKDAITTILSEHGLANEVAVFSPAVKHDPLIQYQSVDFDFIVSRAEAGGMIVYCDKDKLCVKAPEAAAGGKFPLDFSNSNILSFNFQLESSFQLDKVNCQAWDVKKQTLAKADAKPVKSLPKNIKNTLSKLQGSVGKPVVNRLSSAPLSEDELKSWANAQLMKSALTAFNGNISYIGEPDALPELNKTVDLKGFSGRYNGPALVTHIRHTISENRWVTEVGFGLSPHWHYEEWTVSQPPAVGLMPGVQGLMTAKVKKIHEDPSKEHHIQVEVPALGIKASDLIWARMASFYATKGKGANFYPEVGDEVIIGFLQNDPRHAVVLGSLYSSGVTPPYPANEKNSIKGIVTKADLKLELDDENKVVTIMTPGKNQIVISDKDKSIVITDQNKNTITMDSKGISLDSAKDIKLTAKGNIVMDAKANLNAKGATAAKIESAKIEIKAQAQLKASASGQAEFSSGGMVTVKSGAIMQIQGSLVKIN